MDKGLLSTIRINVSASMDVFARLAPSYVSDGCATNSSDKI